MYAVDKKIEIIKQFTAFEYLTEKQQVIVAGQIEFVDYAKKERVFKAGDIDHHDYFLLSGTLELEATDGKSYELTAGTPHANKPVSTLRPRKYTAMAKTKCKLMKIQHELLTYVINLHNENELNDQFVEFSHSQLTPEMVTSEIKQSIIKGELKLPSLPDIAVRIRKFAKNNDHSMEDMVQVILMDPSMSAKIIQCANSPLFRGVNPIRSCTDAAIRLGKETTVQLVTLFSMRELFSSSSKELEKIYKDIWRKSVNVAVLCAVLAKKSKLAFDPEVAMLTGLLHRIGELSIYSFANEYHGFLKLDEVIEHLVKDYRSAVACDIIQYWQLGDVYFQSMKYMEHWDKEQVMFPDYADLLNIAILHEYIHNHEYHNLPHFDELESFKRIQVGPSTPEFSIECLQESKKELSELKSMLMQS